MYTGQANSEGPDRFYAVHAKDSCWSWSALDGVTNQFNLGTDDNVFACVFARALLLQQTLYLKRNKALEHPRLSHPETYYALFDNPKLRD